MAEPWEFNLATTCNLTRIFNIPDRSLIERQKERLGRLAMALAQEKGRLAQLSRENQILAAPPPPPVAAQRLKEYVERLRDQCDTLSKRLEMIGNGMVLFISLFIIHKNT